MARSISASSMRLSSSVKNNKCDEPAEEIVDRLVALDRLDKRAPRLGARRERGELAFVRLGESRALGVRAVEIAFDLRRVDAGVEIRKVPLGQAAEPGRTLGG